MAHISEGYDPDKIVMIGGCGDAGLTIAKAISAMPKDRQIVIAESAEESVLNHTAMALIPDGIDMPFRLETLIYALGMAAMAGPGLMPRRLFPKDRPFKKCLLPGCEEMTNHRGGYCRAEHCKAHKVNQQIRKKGR